MKHVCLVSLLTLFTCTPTFAEEPNLIVVDRDEYINRIHGMWLGQSIANWTGLVTEMDKIGGEGPHGEFYTREDWGTPDQPSIWGQGVPSNLSSTINFVFENEAGQWGSDDDTDIEFIYWHEILDSNSLFLTAEQIRNSWLQHIYSDEETPFTTATGEPENFLWVSNQQAFDLMEQGLLPPHTGAKENNPHYDMIDAQLTTEFFGAMAPGRPDIALKAAELPILTTARENAAWASQFYVVMYSLAAVTNSNDWGPEILKAHAEQARLQLPDDSYSAAMYRFVLGAYERGLPWEQTRDQLYQRFQVEQQFGYDLSSRDLYCNGCFASGINFGASLISLFYGEGDFKETLKIASLAGWDSDNPAATWGGMLGLILGKDGIERAFDREFSDEYYIHRTRKGFPNDGVYSFHEMATQTADFLDAHLVEVFDGEVDEHGNWAIPPPR